MKTKVTILGEQPTKTEPKKIKFIKWIDESGNLHNEGMSTQASGWNNVELVCRNYRDGGFDLMFCYDGDIRNGCKNEQEPGFTGYTQILVLGHFNDGVV